MIYMVYQPMPKAEGLGPILAELIKGHRVKTKAGLTKMDWTLHETWGYGGFLQWGVPQKWLVYKGKSY